jgi:WD40 repeat protein
LAKIARYATPTPKGTATPSEKGEASTAPLVILGEGGSGKSSLLARAVQERALQPKPSDTVILQRYIGGVPGTESLMTMLTDLTADITSLYGQPEPPIPESAKSLAETFQAALCHASADRPLALYLDALDQLDSTDSARMLEWLPKELPEHVRVVTTVRIGTTVEQSARRRYPRNLIEVPLMKPAEGRAMLKAWLKDRRTAWFNAGIAPTTGRRLTANQQLAVLRVFGKSGNALWLKLAYEEAATWASWDKPRKLPTTVQGLIEDFLEHRLLKKENHPKVFTEQALAYLTAGRFGLSESELGRTLGLDPAVRAEFQANEKTQKKWSNSAILPPILWSRLFFDLQAYLGLAKVDGALLMRWFHREFAEVLKARYLGTPEQRHLVHGTLADTFQMMELEYRPEETNDDALFKATDVTCTQITVALRRVMEQPWQLARAGKFENLQILLTNFGFCMAKCAARRGGDLIRDIADSDFYNEASSSQRVWAEFLLSVGHALRSDSPEWPAHRILLQLLLEDPALENRDAFETWIARHASWPVARALLNLTSGCERFPMVTFDGHTCNVSGVHPLSKHRLLSWSSAEHDIQIWNAFTGEVLGALRHESNVVDVEVMPDERVLSSSQDQMLTVWSLESQELITIFRVWEPQPQGVGGFRSIDAERFVHWSARREPWDYSITVRSLQSGAILAALPSSPNSGHTDFILGVLPLDDDSLLSWSTDQTLRRWHITSGECQAATLDLEAPIVKVELSEDGAIHVRTTPSLWGRETELWVLCAKSLIPLQDPQKQAALKEKGDRLTIKWNKYQSEIRWAGPRITLYPAMPNKADDLHVMREQSASNSDSAVRSPPQLTTLKILQNNKVLAGLSEASLALFEAQTGKVIDQLPGRADCAGSGCLLEENTLAIWPTDGTSKNLLRIWHPAAGLKVDRHYVSQGRISGAESLPSGLLTWGGRSITSWQLAPLRLDGLLQHPSEIRFVRRLNSNGDFVSCDSEGNVSFWQESNLGGAIWFHTGLHGVDDARLDGVDRLLVLYQKSGRDFIEGFSVLSNASLGVSRRVFNRPSLARRRVTKQVPQGIKVSGNTVSWKTDRGDSALWVNRGGALDLFTVTPLGTLIARRGGELLLIHTGTRMYNSDATHADRGSRVNCITDADLENLRLSPLENPAKKAPKSWPEVFALLRQWAANKDLAGLDSPDFTGSTWVGGGVLVMSAHSPRAAQDVKGYRNISWAHQDRFSVITLFPKAIESLLKRMRGEVSPHSFMDKNRFYTQVAKSMATAEQQGGGLHSVLLAGVERAHELVQEHHNGQALNKD